MISLAHCNSTAERDFSSCLLDIHSFPQFQFKTYTTVNEITVVRFLTKCECILNANARFTRAALNGHLGLLKWVRLNGCPWNEETCADAA